MITRQMLEELEAYYKSLRDVATTLDIAISEPLYSLTQAAWDAMQQARVDFITPRGKTPQIAELPVCPLCEERAATVGMSDHLYTVLMVHEEDVGRDDLICETCHEKWSEDYPEETKAARISRDCANGYAHWYYPDVSKWDDGWYDGPIEADSKQQQAQDVRSQLH